jgi:hypothetical protein
MEMKMEWIKLNWIESFILFRNFRSNKRASKIEIKICKKVRALKH